MAFSIIAKLGLDKSGFDSTFAGLSSSLKGRLAGLFGTAAIAAYTRKTIEAASAINDQSAALNVSQKFFQQASYAAKQTGSNISEVGVAFKKMQQAQIEAVKAPGGDQAAAFARMGVSIEDLKRLSPEDLFLKISDHAEKAGNSQLFLADAVEIFGRNGQAIIPMMLEGFRGLADEASALGTVMDEEVVETLDSLGDSLDSLAMRFQSAFASIADSIIGGIKKALDWAQPKVDAAAAYYYAKFSGLSENESVQAGREVMKESEDEIIRRDEALKAKREARRKRQGINLPELPNLAPIAAQQRFEAIAPQLNSLQRIGAQVSESNTIQIVLKESLNVAKRTAVATENLDRKTVRQETE